MVRRFFLAAGLAGLAGCAAWPSARPATEAAWRSAAAASREYDFGWRLSGDPAVAPLQVFDDGREIWLQFAPDQPVPAIFGVDPGGMRVLPYARRVRSRKAATPAGRPRRRKAPTTLYNQRFA